jgi:periplasmic divalent cation tolerance protein
MAAAKSSILVFVTAGNQEDAARIGRALVEDRLAACANLVGPIRSIYRWQDKVEDSPEHLLLIKTRANLYPQLQARVRQLHPYEIPEIIAVDIKRGLPQYLDWVHESTGALRQLAARKGDGARRSQT